MRLLKRQKKLGEQLEQVSKQLTKLNENTSIQPQKTIFELKPEAEERLCSLELKMKMLWELLTKETKKGDPKLSGKGRLIAGQNLSDLLKR